MKTVVLKGGEGSGNFGHAGRPGKVGGSAATVSITVPKESDMPQHWANNKYIELLGGWPTEDANYLYHATTADRLDSIRKLGLIPGGENVNFPEYGKQPQVNLEQYALQHSRPVPYIDGAGYYGVILFGRDLAKADKHGNVVVRRPVLLRVAKSNIVHKKLYPQYPGNGEYRSGPIPPENLEIFVDGKWENIVSYEFKGGAGSGNFGHAGRPGLVGGSASRDVENNTSSAGGRAWKIPATIEYDGYGEYAGQRMTGKFEWYVSDLKNAIRPSGDPYKYTRAIQQMFVSRAFDDVANDKILNEDPGGISVDELRKPGTKGPKELLLFNDALQRQIGEDPETGDHVYSVIHPVEDGYLVVEYDTKTKKYKVIDGDDEMVFDDQVSAHKQFMSLYVAYKPILDIGYVDWYKSVSFTQRSAIKDAIARKLSLDTGLPYEQVDKMVHQWAVTSNGDMRSLSLQRAVQDELGSNMSKWQKEAYDDFAMPYYYAKQEHEKLLSMYDEAVQFQDAFLAKNPIAEGSSYAERRPILDAMASEWHKLHPDGGYLPNVLTIEANFIDYWKNHAGNDSGVPLYDDGTQRKFVRAMYENTQEHLRKLGYKPDDKIRLFRGTSQTAGRVTLDDVGKTVKYNGNAAEAWSLAGKVAATFGEYMLAMEVPVKNILATSRTGWGCIEEGEVVIINNGNGGATASVIYSTLE